MATIHQGGISTVDQVSDVSDLTSQMSLNIPSNDENALVMLSSDNKRLICAFLGCVDTVTLLREVCRAAFPAPCYDSCLADAFKQGFLAGSDMPKSTAAFSGLNQAIRRKRIRTNGYYALKEMLTKAPNNDSFWEERKVVSIETIHYRTVRFLRNGRFIYALNTHAPWENPLGIEPKAQGMDEETRIMTLDEKRSMKLRESANIGYWSWNGKIIEAQVDVQYCTMVFQFELMNGADSYGNYHGCHTVLQMTKMAQIVDKGTRRESLVEFKLPINPDFIFHRRWYMDPRDTFK